MAVKQKTPPTESCISNWRFTPISRRSSVHADPFRREKHGKVESIWPSQFRVERLGSHSITMEIEEAKLFCGESLPYWGEKKAIGQYLVSPLN